MGFNVGLGFIIIIIIIINDVIQFLNICACLLSMIIWACMILILLYFTPKDTTFGVGCYMTNPR